jgi:tetratricopeptide (TPR) repeat protein
MRSPFWIRVWMTSGMVVALALAPLSVAQSGPNAPDRETLYNEGAYEAAAAAAEAEGDADSLAFAARALLAGALTDGAEPDPGVVDEAETVAKRALALNPRHDEGSLQLAIALSLKTRAMGVMEAWGSGDGERGKKLALDVLARDPQNFYALGFLAVWHVEVRRRGGPMGAQMMGASLEDAATYYARAAKIAPDDVGIHWQYGRALTGLDARRFRNQALAALDAALAAKADNHVERVMQARARELADLLRSDRRKAEARAAEML